MEMEMNCNNCQWRENADGSECIGISERSQREIKCSLCDNDRLAPSGKKCIFCHDGSACGRWKAEPNRFYAVEGKRFRSFPYYPTGTEEYDEGIEDGTALVKVKDIVKAYFKLNHWKRSVIIFYVPPYESDFPGYSTVLMPSEQNITEQKQLTKLVKAMIPLVSFSIIMIDDLWDKTEEDVARAAAAPPPVPPLPNDKDVPHDDRDAISI